MYKDSESMGKIRKESIIIIMKYLTTTQHIHTSLWRIKNLNRNALKLHYSIYIYIIYIIYIYIYTYVYITPSVIKNKSYLIRLKTNIS